MTLAIVGCAVTMLGSILPWATIRVLFLPVEKNGTEGDGVLTLLLAGTALGLVFARRGGLIASAVLSTLAAVIAVYDIIDVSRFADDLDGTAVSVSVGYGLWVTAVGAVGASIAAFVAVSRYR